MIVILFILINIVNIVISVELQRKALIGTPIANDLLNQTYLDSALIYMEVEEQSL